MSIFISIERKSANEKKRKEKCLTTCERLSVFHIKIDDEILLKLDASLKWKHVFHSAKKFKTLLL